MPKERLTKEIDELTTSFPGLQSLSQETLFSLVCLKYFYHSENFTYSHRNDCFVDGRNDGGIDLVVVSDVDGYTSTLSLIQCKFVDSIANKQDVIDIFTKMRQTYDNFQQDRISTYNDKLKRILKDRMDFVSDTNNSVEYVLFLSIDADAKRKEEIESHLRTVENLKDLILNIHYLDDIEEQIRAVKEPARFVEDGKIRINKDDGILRYGKDGILVNVSGVSLRDIYYKYKDHGLFEQNFRYFVRNKKIDDNIRQSLSKKRPDFWFLNNGIIICCQDFREDGDNVKLSNFSIVNGCQTTTLIGEYKGTNENEDFLLPCKIIRSSQHTDDEFAMFMSNVAEASNSQKPISDRDLKANRPEQRALQRQLKEHDPPIYLEIKRGERIRRGLEPWRKTKNETVGQLVLSFHLQQPGTARNGKGRIFSNDAIYKSVFLRKQETENLVDLLKLANYYDAYLNEQLENDSFLEVEQNAVASNGKFVILALLGLLLKNKRGLMKISGSAIRDGAISGLEEDNLQGDIFDGSYVADDFRERLNDFFGLAVRELASLFKTRITQEKTVSNFFKSDSKYQTTIVRHFLGNIVQDSYNKKRVDHYLAIFA